MNQQIDLLIIDYLAKERLGLSRDTIQDIEASFKSAFPQWQYSIEISFLSPSNKLDYLKLLRERFKRLELR